MFKCPVCNKFLSTAQGLKSHTTRLHKNNNSFQSVTATAQDLADAASTDSLEGDTSDLDDFLQELASLRACSKLIRRIPKGARGKAADALSATIDMCVRDNSVFAWKRLLKFASACFFLPSSQTETKVSLATVISRNVNCFVNNEPPMLRTRLSRNNTTTGNHTVDSGGFPVRLIESKIADGDIRGAVRILSSDSFLAPFDRDTFESLRQKHPPQLEPTSFPEIPADAHPITVTVEAIRAAIASFPAGSAGGMDMFRPQYLKDLTGHSAGVAGTRLLSSLLNLCSHMLKGQVPENICPFLYGAALCALKKKDGGVRPIAVGNTFRRLVAKLGCASIASKLGTVFNPIQLGFGTRGGAEAVAHAARRYLSFPHESPKVFLKLDFSNAFNSIRRDVLLREVCQQIPELASFLYQCYRQPTFLSFGSDYILSSCGIQQGDPLGPGLFCLATQPMAASISTEINLWYLDDGSLGGSPDSVLQDLAVIICESGKLGLDLNLKKCELFCLNMTELERAEIQSKFRGIAPGIRFPTENECVLLGAPLKEVAITEAIKTKTMNLKRLVERLSLLSPHYAFFILKNCFSIPKLTYVLRCAPTWKVPQLLAEFDEALLHATEKITNVSLSELARIQAALPIGDGGLGLRQAGSVALPAFLSSVASVSNLVSEILPHSVRSLPDALWVEATQTWISRTNKDLPPFDQRSSQAAWDRGLLDSVKADLQLRATTLQDKARLLGVSSRESGAFLNAIPSPSLGTFLDENTFRIAVGLRLGADICQSHACPCGSPVDSSGIHGLSCRRSSGRLSRHASVNDVIKRGLVSAGIPVTLEPSFLSEDTNKRPDGITLTPWEGGRSLVWDFTCVDSQAATYLATSAGTALFAAQSAEAKKKEKYAFLGGNYIFIPVAAECLGSFGLESLKVIKSIGRKIREATGEKRATEFLLQRLSIAIQRGNAASVSGSIPRGESLEEYLCML